MVAATTIDENAMITIDMNLTAVFSMVQGFDHLDTAQTLTMGFGVSHGQSHSRLEVLGRDEHQEGMSWEGGGQVVRSFCARQCEMHWTPSPRPGCIGVPSKLIQ